MQVDEIRETGRVAGHELGLVTDLVRDVHRATAAAGFALVARRLGNAGRPVQLVHDAIAAVAYTSTKLGVRSLPPAAALIAGAVAGRTAGSAHDARRGRYVLGVLSGLRGDDLHRRDSALAPRMRIRLHEGRLRRCPANLVDDAAPAGNATGRIVVFVHGLCETDLAWSFAAQKRWGDRTTTYGSMLRDDDGWTPLYVDFNTGVHVSANALELADQLEDLVAAWPVDVHDVAIVGHSLGGLVARSAAHQAHARDQRWVEHLTHVVGLGTPHLGAPLERFANRGTHRLARIPQTRPFATWLNRRSVGIKDLRYGALLEEDWVGNDPDELLHDRVSPATFLPGVTYSVVSATLSRKPDGVFATDLLVQHSSAHGIGRTHTVRSIPFERERMFHLGGRRHHFDLLADQRVYDRLRDWLA